MAEITPLPKRRSPKQLARAYMMGDLPASEYPHQGGLRNAMVIADSAESEIARMQALAFIEKIADLAHDFDTDIKLEVKLVALKNDGAGNIERIASA